MYANKLHINMTNLVTCTFKTHLGPCDKLKLHPVKINDYEMKFKVAEAKFVGVTINGDLSWLPLVVTSHGYLSWLPHLISLAESHKDIPSY